VKLRLLPSSFDNDGSASARQHLTCLVVNDRVAIDAGSLAMGANDAERAQVRDVVLSHAHLDHVAGLPLFLDDLFSSLTEPVRVHATKEVIEVLEKDLFNWSMYPKFSELRNRAGLVVEYIQFSNGTEFKVGELTLMPVGVNHKVPSSGFILNDGKVRIGITGDTASMEEFWDEASKNGGLDALLIECAFPDELADLAATSHHLTPSALKRELERAKLNDCMIYIVNIKPSYRNVVIDQLAEQKIPKLEVLEVGRTYQW
jgi:ribonuclease BN (tRNA processing enzyme)